MPGDAFAQLHGLVSCIEFTVVSEPLDGSPDGFENEAGWDESNDEPEQRDDTSKPKHRNVVGFDLGAIRGHQHVCPLNCHAQLRFEVEKGFHVNSG